MIKIGIVGADGLNKAWTLEREEKAKTVIDHIFANAKLGNVMEFTGESLDFSENYLIKSGKGFRIKGTGKNQQVILVSGHCPAGEERRYCVDCNSWYPNIPNIIFESQWCVKHQNHKQIKVYDKGGVDTWAEIIASQLGVKTEIYPAEYKGWNDWTGMQCERCGFIDTETHEEFEKLPIEQKKYLIKHPEKCGGRFLPFGKKGYRSRNIDIVNAIPLPPNGVLYDIEPKGSCKHCDGKGSLSRKLLPTATLIGEKGDCYYCLGTGNYSGGTFTMNEAEKRGKEVHQIVIE